MVRQPLSGVQLSWHIILAIDCRDARPAPATGRYVRLWTHLARQLAVATPLPYIATGSRCVQMPVLPLYMWEIIKQASKQAQPCLVGLGVRSNHRRVKLST